MQGVGAIRSEDGSSYQFASVGWLDQEAAVDDSPYYLLRSNLGQAGVSLVPESSSEDESEAAAAEDEVEVEEEEEADADEGVQLLRIGLSGLDCCPHADNGEEDDDGYATKEPAHGALLSARMARESNPKVNIVLVLVQEEVPL